MKRRELVLGTGLGLSIGPIAGCLERVRKRRPTEIVDWTTEKGGIETDAGAFDPPEIAVDWAEATVTVTGCSPAGNACGYVRIDDPAFDPDQSDLQVSLHSGSKRSECGDEFNAETYRVTVQFDRGIPERIRVTEPSETATKKP